MKTTCRAMVLLAPEKMEMQTFTLPKTGAQDGLLEVELCGVCGSDPGIFQGKQTFGPRPFPLIMGHEIVGRITEMGRAARQRHGVVVGDRVVVEYAFGCGLCDPCRSGRYAMCDKHYFYGSMVSCKNPPHLFGAYGEYLYIHPNAKVHRIGDGISPRLGVMICAVIGNGIRWLRQIGNVSIGDAVAIVGPGQQGLACVAVAKEAGAGPIFVIGLEKDSRRLDMAGRFGADRTIVVGREDPFEVIRRETGGRMADLVIDVSGHPSGAELGLPLVGRQGTFVTPGIYKRRKASLDLDHIVTKEIRVQGVFSHDFYAVRPAIKMACAGKYPFEEMITHILPLAQAERAVRLVGGEIEGESPLKVVLDPKA
jgi:alcohol dehydrogenase